MGRKEITVLKSFLSLRALLNYFTEPRNVALKAKSRPGAIMASTPKSKMSQKLAEERRKVSNELE